MVETTKIPSDEVPRAAAVRRYRVLDTGTEDAFDRVTALAARVLRAPIAVVSVVDGSRIWFKSHHGLELGEVDRQPGLCASTILGEGPRVVADTLTDPACRANSMVTGPPGVRFYAGVPLRSPDGLAVGVLGVMDFSPRDGLSDDDLATLGDLAALIEDELDLRPDRPGAGDLDLRRPIDLRDRRAPADPPPGQERFTADIQPALIPPFIPRVDGLELLGRYHVAHRAVLGGDFFDVAPASWGTALMIGDVCGKGEAAATEAGMARWTLRKLMTADADPAGAVTALNAFLARDARPQAYRDEQARYVTAVAAAVRPGRRGREVTLAVAGHPKPLLLHRRGGVEPLGRTGPLIGWFENCAYRATSHPLRAGDTLILYTDGCIAASGEDEDEDSVVRAVADLSDAPLEQIAGALEQTLSASRADDAAFLLARVL